MIRKFYEYGGGLEGGGWDEEDFIPGDVIPSKPKMVKENEVEPGDSGVIRRILKVLAIIGFIILFPYALGVITPNIVSNWNALSVWANGFCWLFIGALALAIIFLIIAEPLNNVFNWIRTGKWE